MPSGHTDRTTINRRRKLSPGMLDFLQSLAANSRSWNVLTRPEKNQARALCDRQMVKWNRYVDPIYVTDLGKEELAKHGR